MGVRKKQMAERIKEERKQVAFARLNDFQPHLERCALLPT